MDYKKEVALIFPPLVETNFGSYYPSTAVLAAKLLELQINSYQFDLNEEFALNILKTNVLKDVGRGNHPRGTLEQSDMAAVAARILMTHKDRLFDETGRHNFDPYVNQPAYLLSKLASSFRMDPLVSSLGTDAFNEDPLSQYFEEFFEECDIAKRITKDTKLFGITISMGPQLGPGFLLARHIRKIVPQAKIIFGGPAISLLGFNQLETLIQNNCIDALVRFDGERPLTELAQQAIENVFEPWRVPNTTSIKEGKAFHSDLCEGPSMHTLPFSHLDEGILERLSDPEVAIAQARGCYWGKCTYCDYVELYQGSRGYRARKPAAFVDEMEYHYRKHNIKRFNIVTEALPAPFARKISRLIIDRDLKVKWNSFAMVDKNFTPEIFELMKQAGCEFLVVGIETMTDRVLKLVEKASTSELNIQFLQDARSSGIELVLNLIPDLPTTTYNEATESLRLFKENMNCFKQVSIFPFEATASSQIGRNPGKFGLDIIASVSDDLGQAQFVDNHLSVIDTGMTDEERKNIHSSYNDFAAIVNGIGENQLLENKKHDTKKTFSLLKNDLDFSFVGDRIQCYNYKLQSSILLGPAWKSILYELNSSNSISSEKIEDLVPKEIPLEKIMATLIDHRMIEFQDGA